MEKKHRAAIFGLWWSSNYGSLMTYYSLNRLTASFGFEVFMIDRPGFAPDNPLFFGWKKVCKRTLQDFSGLRF